MSLMDLGFAFVQGMVQSMYKYEADQVGNPDLLTNAEMMNFYAAYCGR